jgi:hypothetical protein
MNMLKKIGTCFLLGTFLLSHLAAYSQIGAQVAPSPASTAGACVYEKPKAESSVPDTEAAGLKVKLYYLREAAKIVELLDAIKEKNTDLAPLIIKKATEDEIVLYGPKELRERVRRIIVTLDLPRPGIKMDMWGIQISSRNPEELAKVMLETRGFIDQTQQDIRETFTVMQESARNIKVREDFEKVLVSNLRFTSALETARPLSFTDILMLMVASKDPTASALDMADALTKFGEKFNAWKKDPKYKDYVKLLPDQNKPPFERFLKTRGLKFEGGKWINEKNNVQIRALQSQMSLLQFALEYGNLVHNPGTFSPYYLQQASETLNTRLQIGVDALNLDLQELFVIPTLIKIQVAVQKFKDVEYASVGKTSVASLSGIPTEVSSSSVSSFDVTPPLRLSELLTTAKTLSEQAGGFVPNPTENLVGAMPLSQVIGLIGAFGEERSVWRELKAGVSITVTPNVLRNMTSAELQLKLETGDPQAGTREEKVTPLSRVSQHNVKTSVYVNALDFFDISSFTNESTLGGGRGYVPIIGPIWRGLFYDVPIFGKLFSWKKNPQTVHHESLVLTTSFITPTVMGVAILYPTDSIKKTDDEKKKEFEQQNEAVYVRTCELRKEVNGLIESAGK